jgi:hypothetical protein
MRALRCVEDNSVEDEAGVRNELIAFPVILVDSSMSESLEDGVF